MEDLSYIFSLGFSGSDLWRGLWIGLCFSLIASRKFRPWKVGILAFVADRIWPFYAMSLHGYEGDVIARSVMAALTNLPHDLAFYTVRYLGILALVYLGYNLRRTLHEHAPEHGPKGKGVLPY